MLSLEQRQVYRSELKAYYFNQQQYKNMDAVKRQVDNMDDKALQKDYDRLKDKLKDKFKSK